MSAFSSLNFNSSQLPWERDGLAGDKIAARELRPRKPWVKAGCWVMTIGLILAGLVTRWRIAAVFGALYVLVLVMQKTVVVTTRGIETFYQMRVTTHYELWPWSEISGIVNEDINHPTLTTLHFNRGDRVRKLFFTRDEAALVIKLARDSGNKIKITEQYRRPARRY